ncbi:MAG TPA: DUF6424 family protein [Burkholderiales bacterium]|jgi:hypothetical protein|nr:DUF6424 family protein [Burkholderiales bacterium]
MATSKSKSKKPQGGGSVSGVHILKEDNPWAIDYAGHEPRADSPLYVKSRKMLTEIAKSTSANAGPAWFYGPDPWEDHHGGGLWIHDGNGWFFVKNFAGMEWASQFCADPAKIERLRQNAARLYQGAFYDNSKKEILKLDATYPFDSVLKTPITSAAQVALWTDSIFNASVPLPKLRHTGVSPKGHGVHHYPTPVFDIELFKRDDFTLWVLDEEKQAAAVVPVHPRGVSKDDPKYAARYGQTMVVYATPGTKLRKRLAVAQAKGKTLVASPEHSFSRAAFKQQQ